MADAPEVIVAGQPFVLVVEPQAPAAMVIAAGNQGPAGRPGAPGPAGGSAVQRQAGETLSALRLVYELNEEVFYLDSEDAEHIDLAAGVTITSALATEPINVQASGPLDDSSWAWQPGPVWLGTAGLLTQSPPEEGFILYIGRAVSPTRIIININQPVELAEE